MGRPFPRNVSKPVECDLPGYEGTAFSFIVSLSKRDMEAHEGNGYKLAAALVNETTGWPFEGERPQHGDAKSFEICPMDLIGWIANKGYQQAIQNSISPN